MTHATVADAMVRAPKVCGAETTVAQLREFFEDEHVHAALIVDGGELLTVVERPDLGGVPPTMPARLAGRLRGRTIGPDTGLDDASRTMTARGGRRLAVIDDDSKLLGLLCLKRSGVGFCSDLDVEARAAEREATAGQPVFLRHPRRR